MKQKALIVLGGVIVVVVVLFLGKSCLTGGGPPEAEDVLARMPNELDYEAVRGDLARLKSMSREERADLGQQIMQKRIKWEGWVFQADLGRDAVLVDMDPPGTDDKAELYVQVVTADFGEDEEVYWYAAGDQVEIAGTVNQVSPEGMLMIRGATVVRR